ncbi:MAG TPA: hypothetical protein VMV10_23270, partial [Pirellulales bacterium]|nr:hypothetical protein [Pirellulales bacterium]
MFAQADPQREAEEAGQEAVRRIERRAVGKPDQFDQVKDQHHDAAAAEPKILRQIGDELKRQEHADAHGRRRGADDQHVRHVRFAAFEQRQDQEAEQAGRGERVDPVHPSAAREMRAFELAAGKQIEEFGAR